MSTLNLKAAAGEASLNVVGKVDVVMQSMQIIRLNLALKWGSWHLYRTFAQLDVSSGGSGWPSMESYAVNTGELAKA